ncbi:cupredoxin family protein [Litoribacillus peritrichatus]
MKLYNKSALIILLGTLSGVAAAGPAHHSSMQNHSMGHSGSMPHSMSHGEQTDEVPAFGVKGRLKDVTRTIDVGMFDTMTFSPEKVAIREGETVRFLITNEGKIPHEFVIGSKADLKAHAEMMRQMPKMKHAEENMVTLNPGQKSAIVWKFTTSGVVDFACLIPGHMEAGMTGVFNVN